MNSSIHRYHKFSKSYSAKLPLIDHQANTTNTLSLSKQNTPKKRSGIKSNCRYTPLKTQSGNHSAFPIASHKVATEKVDAKRQREGKKEGRGKEREWESKTIQPLIARTDVRVSGTEGKRRRGVGEGKRRSDWFRLRLVRSFLPGFNPFRGFVAAENNRRYITANAINPQNFAPKGIRTGTKRELASVARAHAIFARLTTPKSVRKKLLHIAKTKRRLGH